LEGLGRWEKAVVEYEKGQPVRAALWRKVGLSRDKHAPTNFALDDGEDAVERGAREHGGGCLFVVEVVVATGVGFGRINVPLLSTALVGGCTNRLAGAGSFVRFLVVSTLH
jgi:hypothetical protein